LPRTPVSKVRGRDAAKPAPRFYTISPRRPCLLQRHDDLDHEC
jgi:hypothetical protein